MADKGIYWLASYPRSGNTWLRIFIHNLVDAAAGRPARSINDLRRYTLVENDAENFRGLLPPPETPAYRMAVIRSRPEAQRRLSAGHPRGIFVKTHAAVLRMDGQPTIERSVTRGAVYLVRNPLDVACSLAPHLGLSLDEAIERMNLPDCAFGQPPHSVFELVDTWSTNVLTWTVPTPLVLVLRYEDLLGEPEKAFGAFVRHSGMKATPAQVLEAIDRSSFDRLSGQEAAGGFSERPARSSGAFFRVGATGQWRDKLTPAQVDRIVADHRTQMERFGYLPD